MRFGIGAAAARLEDERFVTGKGRYGDDVRDEGAAHAAFVLSPVAAGTIRAIDTAAARAHPGVLGVFTAADLDADGIGNLPSLVPQMASLKHADGSPVEAPARGVLARERVRFVGDAVAAIVATSAAAARDAAELVEVDIDDMAAVTDVSAAALDGAPTVWDHAPDNTAYRVRVGDAAAVDAALSGAAHVARITLPFTRLAMVPLEPRSAHGSFEDGRYILTCGNQSPHIVRDALARSVLGVPPEAIRVVSPDMGGAFGLRSQVFPEMAFVLWAAKTLGRPVRWTGTRSAAFLSDDQGRDLEMTAELGLDGAGRFVALKVRSLAAIGAYMSLFGPLPTFANLGGLAGVYRTPAIAAEVRAVFTNTPPIAPYRGAGRPEAIAAIELAIDRAARDLGVDRFELRRKNMIAPEALPFKTGLTYVYDSGDFPQAFQKAAALADREGYEARRARSAAAGKLRGIGIANAIEAAAGALDEFAEVSIEADGRATLSVGSVNHGQGHETSLRQVLAEVLPVPAERIAMVQGDTDAVAGGVGSFGSRTSGLAGSAIFGAAQEVKAQALKIASDLLEADAADIEAWEGGFRVVGTELSIPLEAVAAAAHDPARGAPGLRASKRFGHADGPTFPNGSHVCEVEIDPETGALTVERYSAVYDVGTALNPMLVEGQIHGGVAQGLAQVLGERMVFDPDTGQPLTASFMDYAIPRADDLPSFTLADNPCPTPKNPLGVKGAGEAGTVGALAAGMAAVLDAVAARGVEWFDMPATPARVWAALNRD